MINGTPYIRVIDPLGSGLIFRVRLDGWHLVFREARGREVRVQRPDARPLGAYTDEELEDLFLEAFDLEALLRDHPELRE